MTQMDHTMLFLCGAFCLGMAIFHFRFPVLFDWKNELPKMSVANRAILQIANRRLIYFFLLVSGMCFLFPDELSTTPLGRFFMIGMSIFWLSRFVEQFVYVRIDHRLVHLLTYLFLIGAILFAVPVLI